MTNTVAYRIILKTTMNKKYKPVTDKEEYPLAQENHLESMENKNKQKKHRKFKVAKCFKNIVPKP